MENEETTVAPETSSTDTTTTPDNSGVEISADSNDSVETETPAFVPDYKLKVYDEEKELDDPFLKDLIKDEVSQKKVKEIAQKYLGFDTVKSRHEKTKSDYQQYQQAAQPVLEYYNKASNYLQKKDYDGFFDFLQISPDDIFKYAVKKAEEAQLPESQRQQIHQQRQIEKDREQLQFQNQNLQSQQYNQLAQFRTQELGWVMARPDVSSLAQAYDSRKSPDAPPFRQLVINQGLAHYAMTGRDLSAEEATQAVMKAIGGFVTPTNGQQSAPNQPQLIKQGDKPPVIPNVSGRGTSPVKKQVRSIDDLKKVRENFSG